MARNMLGCLGRVWGQVPKKTRGGGIVIWQPSECWKVTAEGRRTGRVTSIRQGGGDEKKCRDWNVDLDATTNGQYGLPKGQLRTRARAPRKVRKGRDTFQMKLDAPENDLSGRSSCHPGHSLPVPPSTLQVLGCWARHVACLDLACVPLIWPLKACY